MRALKEQSFKINRTWKTISILMMTTIFCGYLGYRAIEGSTTLRLKIKVACLILSLLLLTGCGNIIDQNSSQSPHKYAVTTFNEVFELIQAKDSRAIFDMFNEDARTNTDIMPQIEKLVEFMDGEITEIGHVGASNAYSSVRDGVTVSAAYTATADVRNDKGVSHILPIFSGCLDHDNKLQFTFEI